MEKDLKIIDKRVKIEENNLPTQYGPPNIVLEAMKKNYNPELIEKLMCLQERHEKNEARKAYVTAMAAFKASPPEILKTKHVSYINKKDQVVEWNHAVLGEICEKIIGSMSEHGLYHRWEMEQPNDNQIKTTCIITHELGHSEKASMAGPPDTSGGKDTLKAVSSTNTLLQRLTLLALTGLAAKGMDNEGDTGGVKFISAAQQIEITDMLKETKSGKTGFLKYMKCESIDKVPASKYQAALVAIKASAKKTPKKGQREPGSDDT